MDLTKYILAVITTHQDKVASGSPVFFANDVKEAEQIANNLEAILDGIAHQLYEGMYIIVKHS